MFYTIMGGLYFLKRMQHLNIDNNVLFNNGQFLGLNLFLVLFIYIIIYYSLICILNENRVFNEQKVHINIITLNICKLGSAREKER